MKGDLELFLSAFLLSIQYFEDSSSQFIYSLVSRIVERRCNLCIPNSDISHNLLTSVSRDAFLVSPNLRSLNMSHNLLSSLSAPWPPLPSLHTLVLSSNPVASLDLCTLAQLPQLADLQVKLSKHRVVETRGHDTIKTSTKSELYK